MKDLSSEKKRRHVQAGKEGMPEKKKGRKHALGKKREKDSTTGKQ